MSARKPRVTQNGWSDEIPRVVYRRLPTFTSEREGKLHARTLYLSFITRAASGTYDKIHYDNILLPIRSLFSMISGTFDNGYKIGDIFLKNEIIFSLTKFNQTIITRGANNSLSSAL